MPIERYDAIIIGAGQGGDPMAREWAKRGHRTALIERSFVGGTCVNWGCTPSKTMAASARIAYLARRTADFGVDAGPVTVDMGRVSERKRRLVEDARNGMLETYAAISSLDLIHGEARFAGPKRIEVTPIDGGPLRVLDADLVFINTGLRPSVPKIDGLSDVPSLDSTSLMELDATPDHLVVLGGGYVAVEFAQMFRRFGSQVTIIERGPQLLSREDPDVSEAVQAILRDDGITIDVETEAVSVRRAPDGVEVRTRSSAAGQERSRVASHLLVATGRVPNTDRLDLDAAGIEVGDGGFIRVNGRLETTAPGVYAIGDVKGGPAFTHISYDDFRILKANLLDGKTASTEGRIVPYVIFMDPQLARVGLSEREARDQGLPIRVARLPMTETARATEMDETRGFWKAVVDALSGQILGGAFLSIDAGEVIAAMEVAMMARLPYAALRDGVFTHPTLAESLNNLFMTLDE